MSGLVLMNVLSVHKRIQAENSFGNGNSIRLTAKICGIAIATAANIYRAMAEEAGTHLLCPCGRYLGHRGWCHHRYENSFRRKQFISNWGKRKKKRKAPDECISRSNKEQWIKYMLANPLYFEETVGVRWSEEVVLKVAGYYFKLSICRCCGKLKHEICCLPVDENEAFEDLIEEYGDIADATC